MSFYITKLWLLWTLLKPTEFRLNGMEILKEEGHKVNWGAHSSRCLVNWSDTPSFFFFLPFGSATLLFAVASPDTTVGGPLSALLPSSFFVFGDIISIIEHNKSARHSRDLTAKLDGIHSEGVKRSVLLRKCWPESIRAGRNKDKSADKIGGFFSSSLILALYFVYRPRRLADAATDWSNGRHALLNIRTFKKL